MILPPFPEACGPHLIRRRSFLVRSATLAAAAIANRVWSADGAGAAAPAMDAYPFQLGVASGDPSADGFVLWTRLAPRPLEGGGMPDSPVRVDWRVAEDEGMSKVVRSGQYTARGEWAHSVHVEVAGLKPGRWYWYDFKVGMEVSPRGRTRTLEAPGTAADQTPPLRIAVASCQHFEAGHYTAYRHMLAESPDLVLHLGDYIYEGRGKDGGVRRHAGEEIMTLADYRNRHAQYKTDPALQAMHQAAPWLVTWDDHEFDNNCAGGISEELGVATAAFLSRRAAAYQAYYEHMPLRAACIPKGPDMKIFRRVSHGQLVDFHVLDTRQYRSDQPHGDGLKKPGRQAEDPAATLLGSDQRGWLLDGLGASPARWQALAQQVMMARVDRVPGDEVKCSMDQWPGYEAERRALLRAFLEGRAANPVVLTGDIHSNWANELVADFDDLDSKVVGSEFVCTSITSNGDGAERPGYLEPLLAENPFVKHHGTRRGYVSCTIDPRQWRADFRTVPFVTRPDAPVETRASFVVESGKAGLQTA
jgi:alkaline phosphatase D